jgi:hypothetical protein
MAKKRKLTRSERRVAEEHRWYRKQFAGPGDGLRKYTQAEWLDALNRRDRVLFRQRDQIKRLTAQRNVAQFELQESEHHCYEKHGCDFICRHVTTIDPIDTPILSIAEKTKAPFAMHGWIADKLEPVPTTTATVVPTVVSTARAYMEKQKELESMRTMLVGMGVGDMVNWDEFGKLYRNLDKQYSPAFDADKAAGWWWRVPYGWLLKLKEAFNAWGFGGTSS